MLWTCTQIKADYYISCGYIRELQHHKRRLYRTDSEGTYRQVADIPVATSTYTDTKLETALGEAIPSRVCSTT